jgi:hypothetical protein
MQEMVLPKDKLEVFNKPLEEHLEDTNQQLKNWLLRWRPVIDHSMKEVKELAQDWEDVNWQEVDYMTCHQYWM